MPSRVSEILLEQGRNAARARERSGDIWGQTVANLGQIPGQILAHRDQQRDLETQRRMQQARLGMEEKRLGLETTHLEMQQQKAQEAHDEKALYDKLLSSPDLFNPDNTVNRTGVQKLLQDANAGHALPHFFELADTLDEGLYKTQKLQQDLFTAKQETLGRAAVKLEPMQYDVDSFRASVAGLAKAKILSDDDAVGYLRAQTPEDVKAIVSQWKAGTRAGEQKILKLGPGDVAFDERTMQQVATGLPRPATAPGLEAAEQDLLAKRLAAQAGRGPALTPTEEDQLAAYRERKTAPEKPADQNKLEQQYRTVLGRALSNRSGTLGVEDAKVNQALHLMAIFDQSYNPKTKEYEIPAVLEEELALGLARLVSPGGVVGVQLAELMNQPTAFAKLKSMVSYVTGKPQTSNTQAVYRMFKDSIERQGALAEQNREGAMSYLQNLAPTELEESRRQQLESATLNSFINRKTKGAEGPPPPGAADRAPKVFGGVTYTWNPKTNRYER